MTESRQTTGSRCATPRFALACAAGLTAVLLATAGCKLGPEFAPLPPPLPEQWDDAGKAMFSGQPVDELEWWRTFDDPVLESLVEQALDQNLSLRAAALRIVQARVSRTVAVQALLPLTTASGSYTHNKRSTTVRPDVEVSLPGVLPPSLTGPPIVEISPRIDVYDVGFDAIWELDVWGKARRRIEAATAGLEATYAGYDDMMVSLAGEVAAAYIQRQALVQRLATMKANIKVMEDFQTLAEERFANGESPETDVQLARTLVALVAVGIPRMESALRQTENALCILLGEAPRALEDRLAEADSIPSVPAALAVGVPTDLLRRRPDVRAAERLAHAECARIGLAKAAILPSFNLLGAFGWTSSHSGDLFDSASLNWTYGGLIKATPLINYPLTIERVRLADAQFEEAMARYQEVALNAAREVDDAMTSAIKAQDERAVLEDGKEAAARSAELAVEAYKQGQVIVSVPLVALTFKANLEDQAISAQAGELKGLVAVYKSLGGGWETRQQEELVPAQVRERMKERTDWKSFWGKGDLNTVREEPAAE